MKYRNILKMDDKKIECYEINNTNKDFFSAVCYYSEQELLINWMTLSTF